MHAHTQTSEGLSELGEGDASSVTLNVGLGSAPPVVRGMGGVLNVFNCSAVIIKSTHT